LTIDFYLFVFIEYYFWHILSNNNTVNPVRKSLTFQRVDAHGALNPRVS